MKKRQFICKLKKRWYEAGVFYGRDDWIDVVSLRRTSAIFAVAKPAVPASRLLLVVEPACRCFVSTASAAFKTKKTSRKGRSFCFMVGMTGFEPATTCTPCKCATRLRYIPNTEILYKAISKELQELFYICFYEVLVDEKVIVYYTWLYKQK